MEHKTLAHVRRAGRHEEQLHELGRTDLQERDYPVHDGGRYRHSKHQEQQREERCLECPEPEHRQERAVKKDDRRQYRYRGQIVLVQPGHVPPGGEQQGADNHHRNSGDEGELRIGEDLFAALVKEIRADYGDQYNVGIIFLVWRRVVKFFNSYESDP